MKPFTPIFLLAGLFLNVSAETTLPKKTETVPSPEEQKYNIQMQEDQVRGTELDKKRRIQKEEERNKKLIQDAEKAMMDEVDF